MDKTKNSIKAKKVGKKGFRGLPFGKKNYYFLGAGLVIIVLGYISLAQGPVNSFWSLTLAPILLVIGYCILIPIGILIRDKDIVGD
jgi:hypothetical protein